jgi:arylsulfatase A-like enzyme
MKRVFPSLLLSALVATTTGAAGATAPSAKRSPNVVLIYADDLGYGDVGCNGSTYIKTPNVDALAAAGCRFTSGYCTAATCTPSRYSILTGEYPWRKSGTQILPGDAKLIIEPGRQTLASVFHDAGYATAAVGKWHLGFGEGKGDVDWNHEVKPGPHELGFDYSYLMPSTLDRVPCVFMENQKVVGLDPADPIEVNYRKKVGDEPTGKEHPELLRMKLSLGHDGTIINGVSRIGFMKGGKSARWVDEDIADTIVGKACAFMEKNKEKPFFLYFASHDIHVPRMPAKRFVGKSGLGPRGDSILEFDWSVGALEKKLEELHLAEDTIVILTSDNGPVLDDGYADQAAEKFAGLPVAGPFSGGKYCIAEGGCRVPFIVKWPGRIKPGVSAAVVSQVDLLASFASFLHQKVSPTARDSENVLPALLNESPKGRDAYVEQGMGPQGIRVDRWKLIWKGDGGNRGAKAGLYDLETDPAERHDLTNEQPAKTEELGKRYEEIKAKR